MLEIIIWYHEASPPFDGNKHVSVCLLTRDSNIMDKCLERHHSTLWILASLYLGTFHDSAQCWVCCWQPKCMLTLSKSLTLGFVLSKYSHDSTIALFHWWNLIEEKIWSCTRSKVLKKASSEDTQKPSNAATWVQVHERLALVCGHKRLSTLRQSSIQWMLEIIIWYHEASPPFDGNKRVSVCLLTRDSNIMDKRLERHHSTLWILASLYLGTFHDSAQCWVCCWQPKCMLTFSKSLILGFIPSKYSHDSMIAVFRWWSSIEERI